MKGSDISESEEGKIKWYRITKWLNFGSVRQELVIFRRLQIAVGYIPRYD